MKSSDELAIYIGKDLSIIVEEKCQDGRTSYKEVSPREFVKCVEQSLELGTVHSGLLPQNCLSYSTDSKGNIFVVTDFDYGSADITFEQTRYNAFPLPRLLFGFSIGPDDRIRSVNLGVAAPGKITPNTKMYRYPFSNVSGFRLCTGRNSLPAIKSLHQLDGIPHFILSMPNNMDHFSISNNKPNFEYRELLEHLKDKDSAYYYENILIESGKTVSDFIDMKKGSI